MGEGMNFKELLRRSVPWLIIVVGVGLWFSNMGARGGGALSTGMMTPDVEVALADGDRFRLQETQGVTVVNFWASWCGPCRHEAPALSEVAAELPASERLVGLTIENMPQERAASLASQLGMNFPVGVASRELAQGFGVTNLPTTFVINANHEVSARFVGGVSADTLREAIADAR